MGRISIAERIRGLFGSHPLDEELFDDLADMLVEGDLGAAMAMDITDRLRASCSADKERDSGRIRRRLAELLESELRSAELTFRPGEFSMVLLLGVNGVGKTTTAAKLAKLCRDRYGMKPLLAAADTFRAAATEQLQIHGERLGLRVVAHRQGGDPAAVLFDAIDAAQSKGHDLVIADTAGRMHNKAALVSELAKMERVARTKIPIESMRRLLVVDATTGTNGVRQAEAFNEAVALDGFVLTKYDSTARGGSAFAISRELGIGCAYVCDGEGYDDIGEFDARSYAEEFVSVD